MKTILVCLYLWRIALCNRNASSVHELGHLLQERIMTDYDQLKRPFQHEDTPVVVNVSIFVYDISSISEIDMDYSINFFLRQEWIDPRLAFPEISQENETVTLSHTLLEYMWLPDLFILNEKQNGVRHSITVPNVLLRITPSSGTVLLSQRITTKLECSMDFKYYPNDIQQIGMSFEMYGHGSDEIQLEWSDSYPVQIRQQISLPDFNVTATKFNRCDKTYITGSFSCIEVMFELRRAIPFYIIQIYVPNILVVMLSWVSFWIDPESAPARVSLGLLTVLTVATQASGIKESLPKSTYIKAIDIWLFTSGVFVTAAFVEFSIANTLLRMRKKESGVNNACNHRMAATEKIADPPTGTFKRIVDDKSRSEIYPEPSCRERKINTSCADQDCPTTHTNKDISGKLHYTNSNAFKRITDWKIDNWSRILFPLCYVIFNVIYWMWLTSSNDEMSR